MDRCKLMHLFVQNISCRWPDLLRKHHLLLALVSCCLCWWSIGIASDPGYRLTLLYHWFTSFHGLWFDYLPFILIVADFLHTSSSSVQGVAVLDENFGLLVHFIFKKILDYYWSVTLRFIFSMRTSYRGFKYSRVRLKFPKRGKL